ncbi:MAG: hypothetical protein ABI856_04735 [Nitrospira sp.]
MSLANLVTQYIVQYGFRIMGAVLVLIAALFVAKSVGRLFERWLNQQELEPPLRLLLLRLVKVPWSSWAFSSPWTNSACKSPRSSPGSGSLDSG